MVAVSAISDRMNKRRDNLRLLLRRLQNEATKTKIAEELSNANGDPVIKAMEQYSTQVREAQLPIENSNPCISVDSQTNRRDPETTTQN